MSADILRTHKEYNRVFWIVKGRLIPDTWNNATVQEMYKDFYKRLWNNNECYLREAGFEKAYRSRYGRFNL